MVHGSTHAAQASACYTGLTRGKADRGRRGAHSWGTGLMETLCRLTVYKAILLGLVRNSAEVSWGADMVYVNHVHGEHRGWWVGGRIFRQGCDARSL